MPDQRYIRRLTGCRENVSKCFVIPQRVILSMMCSICLICYSAMSGSEKMVLPKLINLVALPGDEPIRTVNHSNLCSKLPVKHNPIENMKFVMDLFYWSSRQNSIISKSYYWSVMISNLPAAILAIRIGGKHVLGVSFLIQALGMLLIPVVLIKFNWMGYLLLKIIRGVTQGGVSSGIFVLISHWIPRTERSLNFASIFFGLPVGGFLGKIVTVKLLQSTNSWETPFYILGTISFLWCILWQLLCYSHPDDHPFIKDEELDYLQRNRDSRRLKLKDIPWRGMVTNLAVWAYFVGDSGHGWVINTLYYQIPNYLSCVLKYNYSVVLILPWLCMGISSVIFGGLADNLIRYRFGTATIRKFFSGISGVAVITCLVTVPSCGCSVLCTKTLFCISMSFFGLFYPGIAVNSFDLTPNFAAILESFTHLLSFVCNWLIDVISPPISVNHTFDDWRSFFWLVLLIQVTSCLIFIIWGSGDVQTFDRRDYTFTSLRRRKEEISDEMKYGLHKI